MLNFAYAESLEDVQLDARNQEYQAIQLSIDKMIASDRDPGNTAIRQEALNFTTRVWSYLLNDLTSFENSSSDELKAALISIGIYFVKYLEKMRKDPSRLFKPLVEISDTIALGLDRE